jgi:hypothetical protein
MATCGTCGTALDPNKALYDDTGMLSCDRCLTLGQVRAGHAKSNKNARSLAYGNLVLGAGSFFFTPLAIASFGVLAFVVGNIRNSEARGEPLPDAGSRVFVAVIGAMLGGAALVLRLLM